MDMVRVTLRNMVTADTEIVIVPKAWAETPYFDWTKLETVGPGEWYAAKVVPTR